MFCFIYFDFTNFDFSLEIIVNLRFLDDKLDRSLHATQFAVLNRDSLGIEAAGIMQYLRTAEANIGKLN